MSAIKRLMTFLICLFVLNSPVFSQEMEFLTAEEIWQDGASWVEVWNGGLTPVYYHWYIDGSMEYEGQTYLKVFSNDNEGKIEFRFGLNVDGSRLAVLVETQSVNGNTGEFVAFPYCDFDDLRIGQVFSYKCVGFNYYGEAKLYDYSYPEFNSKSTLECPDVPGRFLEIYSNDENLYSMWDPLNSRLVVAGLGAVSTIVGLLWPYDGTWPCYRVALQTLYFKDGQGREIFRHPFYDRIMEIVSGIDGATSPDESVCNVYTISGNLVLVNATPEHIDCLPKGIYIKRQGNRAEKILLK